jgi:hypothetical protein
MLHGPCGSRNGPDEVFGRHSRQRLLNDSPVIVGSRTCATSTALPGQSSGPEVSCELPQLVYIGTQTAVAVEITNTA